MRLRRATPGAEPAAAQADRSRPTRRQMLGLAIAGVAAFKAGPGASATEPALPTRSRSARPRSRLLIVGASLAGIALGRRVKQLAPNLEVTLIEREPVFVFRPAQLRYAFGLLSRREIARDYGELRARGLPVVHAEVAAIDRDRRRVVTRAAAIEYDYLALASGMRLADEEVPGLAGQPDANLSPFARAEGLERLRRCIAGFTGGHVLIGSPNGPYSCPPAPYEYAMLWAAHITRRRLKARVTLIDPRSQPTPAAVAEGLLRGMEAYGPVLAYEPFTEVRSVDPASRAAETEVGRLEYDVLSVIPPHRAMSFIADAGLGEPFAEVDPTTFRSSRDERIWALGDTADTPFARTGYTAMDSAAVAAWSIARELGVKAAVPPVPANRCYPMVAADRALLIETHWVLGRDETGGVHVTVTGRHDNRASASHARLRRQWETRAISTLFGVRGDLR